LSTLKDVMSAMKEVLLPTDTVDRAGLVLSEMATELRDHDRRLVRLATRVEIAKAQQRIPEKKAELLCPDKCLSNTNNGLACCEVKSAQK
jgi:hypothetical protein